MKFVVSIMLVMGFLSISTISAQEETKKVIIIKKVKDDNGKVTTKKVEASGKEADSLLKEMKEDGTLEGIDIDMEIEKAKATGKGQKRIVKSTTEDISIEKTINDGEESVTYKITSDNDGEKKVMIWNGDGKMPEEMAKKIEKHKMHQFKTEDGKEMIFIAETDADEKMEKEEEIQVFSYNPNKVTLGVMINDDQGVVIDEIVEGSVAEQSGLKVGDTILKIDDNYTFNIDMLLSALSKYDKQDKCKVTYIRNGKEKKVKVTF